MLRAWSLVALMVIAVGCIGGLAYLDERRRSEQGLDDLGEQEAAVADAASLALRDDVPSSPAAIASLRELERDGARIVLVAPGGPSRRLDGTAIQLAGLDPALARGDRFLRLAPGDAATIGLPERTAMVGLAALANGWRVAVAASAERQRDRDRAGIGRLLLALGLATGLVALFGGMALSRQRVQLELARELAVAEVARQKDVELEQLSRAATMAALGSGVAHEVSTPLGVIVGRAEQLLARAGGDERIAKNAQAIIEQAEHVEHIVRGLLGLARGAPVALQEIAPHELVREAAALVAHRFARANVRLVPVVAADLPTLRCEPLLFKHALVNLLLNACDASPSGATVHVDVHADRVDRTAPPFGGAAGREQVPAVDRTAPPFGGAAGREQVPAVDRTAPPFGGAAGREQVPAVDRTAPPFGGAAGREQVPAVELAFVVTDEGHGITAADAARATEPFFTTKPAGQGTGLGLAIAKEIAATHRGALAIEARSPRGTRASITIPVGGARA